MANETNTSDINGNSDNSSNTVKKKTNVQKDVIRNISRFNQDFIYDTDKIFVLEAGKVYDSIPDEVLNNPLFKAGFKTGKFIKVGA